MIEEIPRTVFQSIKAQIHEISTELSAGFRSNRGEPVHQKLPKEIAQNNTTVPHNSELNFQEESKNESMVEKNLSNREIKNDKQKSESKSSDENQESSSEKEQLTAYQLNKKQDEPKFDNSWHPHTREIHEGKSLTVELEDTNEKISPEGRLTFEMEPPRAADNLNVGDCFGRIDGKSVQLENLISNDKMGTAKVVEPAKLQHYRIDTIDIKEKVSNPPANKVGFIVNPSTPRELEDLETELGAKFDQEFSEELIQAFNNEMEKDYEDRNKPN